MKMTWGETIRALIAFLMTPLIIARSPLPIDIDYWTTAVGPSSFPTDQSNATRIINSNLENSNHTLPNARWLPPAGRVRGVNLGSQFIIEPWMSYDEFDSMGCGGLADE